MATALMVQGTLVFEESRFINKNGGFFAHNLYVLPSGGGRPLEVKASSENGSPLFSQGEEVMIPVYVRAYPMGDSAGYQLKAVRDQEKKN